MPRIHSLKPSLQLIESFFDELPQKAYTHTRLRLIIDEHMSSWNIDLRKPASYVIDFLLNQELLFKNEFQNADREIHEILSWKTTDELVVISGLKWHSYFMYYTAISLHDLTLQNPKVIYLNTERAFTPDYGHDVIKQENIDRAFAKEKKVSEKNILLFRDKRVVLTSTGYTGRLGVVTKNRRDQSISFTNLERTLVDIVVRPHYSGGVFEVLEAFRKAKGKANIKMLVKYLKKLNYIYPYQQAIGFYMEKAGYEPKDIDLLDWDKEFDFYLTYNMRNKSYSDRWRLFYPKGM